MLIEKHIIYSFLKEHTVKLCILFMKIIHWTRNFINTAWVSKDLKEISNSFTSGFTTIFNEKRFCYLQHCVKSVSIRSFSGPHFSEFGLNKKIYIKMRESVRIWTLFTWCKSNKYLSRKIKVSIIIVIIYQFYSHFHPINDI